VAQFARRPFLGDARFPADRPERPAYIRGIEFCPVRRREDEPVVLPQNARPLPRSFLPLKLLTERFRVADSLATGMAPTLISTRSTWGLTWWAILGSNQ
jgi:hypothetical protein